MHDLIDFRTIEYSFVPGKIIDHACTCIQSLIIYIYKQTNDTELCSHVLTIDYFCTHKIKIKPMNVTPIQSVRFMNASHSTAQHQKNDPPRPMLPTAVVSEQACEARGEGGNSTAREARADTHFRQLVGNLGSASRA